VDLVDAAVALTRGVALVLGVGGTLDVDRVGRARPGAQLAPDALLQTVGPAVELVPAVEPRCGRTLVERVLDGDGFAEHRPERHAEAGDRVPELLLEACSSHQWVSSALCEVVSPVARAEADVGVRVWPGSGGTG